MIRPGPHQLTERQAQILAFIRRSLVTIGRAPTFREIAAEIGTTSTNGITDHLELMQRKGVIVVDDMKSRAIRLVVPDGCCAACSQPLPRSAP